MLRLLVCGDRKWANRNVIKRHIKTACPELIIEGEAKGADSIARDIAVELGILVLKFPAQWDKYGKAAGVIRNQEMLDVGKPDMVYAFHNNLSESRGTKDMVERARKAGVAVMVFQE